MMTHHVPHIVILQTAITFETIVRSDWNSNFICILWY